MYRRHRFGHLLSMKRFQDRIRQKHLAISAGIDASYIAGIEGGRRPAPQERLLKRILDNLELTPDERREMEDAAAWDHITTQLERAESRLPTAKALTQLAMLLPSISSEEAEALATVFEIRNRISEKGAL